MSVGYNQQTSGSKQEIFEPQVPYLEDLYARAQGTLGKNTVAGIDPLQQQGGNALVQAAQNLGPYIQNATNASSDLLSGKLSDPNSNPYLRDTANAAIRPIFEQLSESVLPNIRGNASTTGNAGSTRQGVAEGIAAGKAGQSAGDITSNIFSGAFNKGIDAQLQALALAPQTANLGLLPGQVLSDVGTARRGIKQEELLGPIQQLLAYAQLLGPPKTIGESYGQGSGGNVSLPAGG